jgi:hypothetical protein
MKRDFEEPLPAAAAAISSPLALLSDLGRVSCRIPKFLQFLCKTNGLKPQKL